MHLPAEETSRFYRIWFALLHYVDEQEHGVASFPAAPGDASVAPATILPAREALWANDALREGFIAANPAGLPPADLALVASWQHRLAGNFYITRYLKKHTIFLSEHSPQHAYGVLGLVSPIEEILGPYLPVYTRAVLLPFEGRIIYDSLLLPSNVFFGPGIRATLNEAYRDATEREGVLTALPGAAEPESPELVRKAVAARNAKILSAFQKDLAKAGLSIKMIEQHQGMIAAFGRDYLLEQDPPRGLLDLTGADVQGFLADPQRKANKTSFKRFVRFLYNTGRINPDQEADLSAVLKQAGDG